MYWWLVCSAVNDRIDMLTVARSFIGIFICLSLVLTGQNSAVARGATAATGQIVICTGTGTEVLYLDAEGRPTAPPHICPDCVLIFSDGPTTREPVPVWRVVAGSDFPISGPEHVPVHLLTGFLSRAPPWVG